MEAWKTIIIQRNGERIEFNYDISTLGNVRSKTTNNILKPNVKNNIPMISLRIGRKSYCLSIHQLVAQMFLENPNNYTMVNHMNHNKLDNRVENLRWVSTSENANHAHAKKERKTNAKAILQYDENGNFIKKFDSIRQAANELDIPEKQFSSNLTGKTKLFRGFNFEYETPKIVLTEKDLLQFEPIKEHPDYLICRDGRVYSTKSKKIMKPMVKSNNYSHLQMDDKNLSVHFLVANQFIPNTNNCPTVNHKDGDKSNNHVDNLEWMTYSEQNKHSAQLYKQM
jgi:hypothetical protein